MPVTLKDSLLARYRGSDGVSRLIDPQLAEELSLIGTAQRGQPGQGGTALDRLTQAQEQSANLLQKNLDRQQRQKESDQDFGLRKSAFGLDAERQKHQIALDKARFKLDLQKQREEQANSVERLRQSGRATDANIAQGDARINLDQREQAFRETLPTQTDINAQKWMQDSADLIDDSAAGLLAQARKMTFDEEGKRVFADLTSKYRKLQGMRSSLRPQQYQEMMGKWLNDFERAKLAQYNQPEKTMDELLSSQMKDLGNGMAIFQRPDGSFDVMQISPKATETSAPVGVAKQGVVATPQETLQRIATPKDKADITARDAIEKQATENLRAKWERENVDEGGVLLGEYPGPKTDELVNEVKKIVDAQYARQLAYLGIPYDPSGLLSASEIASSQMRDPSVNVLTPEQRQAINEHRASQNQPPLPEVEPPSMSDAMTGQAAPVPEPSPADSAQVQLQTEIAERLKQFSVPQRVNMRNPSGLQLLRSAMKESRVKDLTPDYAISLKAVEAAKASGVKDPIDHAAKEVAKAIRAGTPHWGTMTPMERKNHEVLETQVLHGTPEEVEKLIDNLPNGTFYFNQDMHLKMKQDRSPKPAKRSYLDASPTSDPGSDLNLPMF